MKIQVAGPGCLKCRETEKNVRNACTQLNINAEITHVHDVQEIAKFGVLFTPVVVVDGRMLVTGKLPTVEELKNF
jgi:small redox-active disulfide protein 2